MFSHTITLLLARTGSALLPTTAAAPVSNPQLVDSTLLDINTRHSDALLPVQHYGEEQQDVYTRPYHWTRGVRSEKRYDSFGRICKWYRGCNRG